jgi:hypothetical protein
MKTKYWIYAAALIILLVILTTHSVSSVSASGNSLPAPQGTPPPPSPPPDPGTPEPSGDDDDGGEKKSIINRIINIIFDYRTMKDAIISTVSGMFEDGVADIATEGTELYGLGAEISKIVFPDPEQIKSANQLSMKDVRQSTWREMRKVAFALLPLVAALTIWASMKEGLYSVTGYANTLEAVTELVVSIAIALASYFLMEQAISLTSSLAVAIGGAFEYNIKLSVLAGALIKPMTFANSSPIMAMILYIFALVFLVVFMGSVFIAFLAREVVLVMVVGMAPLMMILGSVRPLGWIRALWTKAFFVVLLILPINVLLLGVSVKLQIIAADLTTGLTGTIFYLLIVVGIISILIAVNSALGKLVYSAAIEVAQKIGSAIEDVVSIGAVLGGAAIGAGGFSALLGGTGGTMGLATNGGGGFSGGGMLASTVSTGGDITQTGNLTKVIGTALSGSRSKVLSGFGRGLSAGSNIKDQQQKQLQQTQPTLPPIDIENNGMPGYNEGMDDVKNLYQGDFSSMPYLAEESILNSNGEAAGNALQATLRAAEDDRISGRLVYKELGVNRPDLKMAGREITQKEVGTAVLGNHSPYMANNINFQAPTTPGLHQRDYAVALRMALNDQKHHGSAFRDPDPQMMGDVARAVRESRLSGMSWTQNIIDDASSQDLQNWVDDKLGNL